MEIMVTCGTRPDALKLIPVIKAFAERGIKPKVCITSQHITMLRQVLSIFDIKPDFDLRVMRHDQTLESITTLVLERFKGILNAAKPTCLIVQGDTTSSFAAALSAYYNQVAVAHVEAGLRTGDKYSPYPEEMNRRLISGLADYHFAPTELAKKNLENEGIKSNVWVTGNTAIDTLLMALNIPWQPDAEALGGFDISQPYILITAHRRESFGEPFEQLCLAIKELAQAKPGIQFIYPVHLNPRVDEPVRRVLAGIDNVFLPKPVDYLTMVNLMRSSIFILTDSGGIQEEAPTLRKPVLVMRQKTERQEGIEAGLATLVGTDKAKIVAESLRLLDDKERYDSMICHCNPYGDGKAAQRIAAILTEKLN